MVSKRSSKLHFSSLIVDTHSDSLGRMVDGGEDLGSKTEKGHMDIPRMRAGNQTAQFFASFVDPSKLTPSVRSPTSMLSTHSAPSTPMKSSKLGHLPMYVGSPLMGSWQRSYAWRVDTQCSMTSISYVCFTNVGHGT